MSKLSRSLHSFQKKKKTKPDKNKTPLFFSSGMNDQRSDPFVIHSAHFQFIHIGGDLKDPKK